MWPGFFCSGIWNLEFDTYGHKSCSVLESGIWNLEFDTRVARSFSVLESGIWNLESDMCGHVFFVLESGI